MKHLMIENSEDYYSKFKDIFYLENKNKLANYYKIHNTVGIGSSEHIFLDSGIEIIINEMTLNEGIKYNYNLNFSNFEIIYCIKGALTCGDSKNKTEYVIKEGDIRFLKNGSSSRWEIFPKNENWKSISICFNNQFLEQISEYNNNFIDEDVLNSLINGMLLDVLSPEIKVAFNQINKCSCSSFCRMLYMQSKAIEIITLFVQNKIFTRDESSVFKIEDIKKIKHAKEVITNEFIDPLSIKDLSKYVGLNTFKLKVGFKEIYNTTIYGYIRNLRMEKAREYLIEGQKNVIEIANMVGYSNPSHFSVAFKKKFGVNPSELKRRVRI